MFFLALRNLVECPWNFRNIPTWNRLIYKLLILFGEFISRREVARPLGNYMTGKRGKSSDFDEVLWVFGTGGIKDRDGAYCTSTHIFRIAYYRSTQKQGCNKFLRLFVYLWHRNFQNGGLKADLFHAPVSALQFGKTNIICKPQTSLIRLYWNIAENYHVLGK